MLRDRKYVYMGFVLDEILSESERTRENEVEMLHGESELKYTVHQLSG